MSDIESLGVLLSEEVAEAVDDLVALRRALHQEPELSLQEKATQQTILDRLTDSGIEARPIGGTGVVGLIEGEKPGRVLLLRADMDALPITEENDIPYCSNNRGVMHACGHDAHVAMLVTVARLLAKRGIEQGAVKLMFQPAEEGAGGAKKMLDAGVLKDPEVDGALAFHVWTPIQIGKVVALGGPVAASVDGFKIIVHGKGTHAAIPESGVDPIAIAAQIVTSAQSLVTRRIGPIEPALLSFTAFNAGKAFNVIPDTAELKGTFRTFDERVRELLRRGLIELASSIASSFGGSAEYESTAQNIPVVNDPEIASVARDVAARVVGKERIIAPKPLMVGEDIGEVFKHVPGALVLLGCGNKEIDAHYPNHHPRFNIDERVLPIGVEIALGFVKRFLLTKGT